jgi:hypothetical protein
MVTSRQMNGPARLAKIPASQQLARWHERRSLLDRMGENDIQFTD